MIKNNHKIISTPTLCFVFLSVLFLARRSITNPTIKKTIIKKIQINVSDILNKDLLLYC